MVERLERIHLEPTGQLDLGTRLGGRDQDLDVAVLAWNDRPIHLRATYLHHPNLMGA